jgi:hypothetical protein
MRGLHQSMKLSQDGMRSFAIGINPLLIKNQRNNDDLLMKK